MQKHMHMQLEGDVPLAHCAATASCRLEMILTHTNVRDQVLDGGLLKQLGEQARPVGVNRHICGLHQRRDVVGLHAAADRHWLGALVHAERDPNACLSRRHAGS